MAVFSVVDNKGKKVVPDRPVDRRRVIPGVSPLFYSRLTTALREDKPLSCLLWQSYPRFPQPLLRLLLLTLIYIVLCINGAKRRKRSKRGQGFHPRTPTKGDFLKKRPLESPKTFMGTSQSAIKVLIKLFQKFAGVEGTASPHSGAERRKKQRLSGASPPNPDQRCLFEKSPFGIPKNFYLDQRKAVSFHNKFFLYSFRKDHLYENYL